MMNNPNCDLLNQVLMAHGGLERWREFSTVRANIVSSGSLWDMKGLRQDSTPRQMTVWLHEQRASLMPFGAPNQRTAYSPERIAIETIDGEGGCRAFRSQDVIPGACGGHSIEVSLGLTCSCTP